jgi:hypothetical protein
MANLSIRTEKALQVLCEFAQEEPGRKGETKTEVVV